MKSIERLFLVAGVAALGWCVYVVGDAYLAQHDAREALMSNGTTATPSAPDDSTSSLSPPAPVVIARGTPLAELSIPRLGLSAVVLHGSDEKTLRLGLGHIENTPLPGQSGNVSIAGHRDSFFRPLRNVRVGDDILLNTPQQQMRYRVSSFRVVSSYEVSVIAPTKDAELTLVTCYPFWFIGSAPDRFVVRATRVENPTAVASAVPAPAADARSGLVEVPATQEAVSTVAATASARAIPSANSARARAAGLGQLGVPEDDDARVRQTVERFRVAYNARLARDGEARVDGFITLPFCEVAVTEQSATATCRSGSESTGDQLSPVWNFMLDKIGGEWSVTSVGMR